MSSLGEQMDEIDAHPERLRAIVYIYRLPEGKQSRATATWAPDFDVIDAQALVAVATEIARSAH